jgi:hypothetical protein
VKKKLFGSTEYKEISNKSDTDLLKIVKEIHRNILKLNDSSKLDPNELYTIF